jgi:hypothetical protein
LLHYARKYNIRLPDEDRIMAIAEKLPQTTKSQQRNKTTEDSTEPKILFS